MPHAFSPYSRPKPHTDDRATSDRLRNMDCRAREYVERCKAGVRECLPRRRGSNGEFPKSPYPAAVDDSPNEKGTAQCGKGVVEGLRDGRINKCRNAVEIDRYQEGLRRRGAEFDRLKEGYWHGTWSWESAVDEYADEDGWMIVAHPPPSNVAAKGAEHDKNEEKRVSADPFADTQNVSDESESGESAATSQLGRVLESPDVDDPFVDLNATGEDDSSSSTLSAHTLCSSGMSEDRISDYDFPDRLTEVAITEAKKTALGLVRKSRFMEHI